jgi:hypothetical protein
MTWNGSMSPSIGGKPIMTANLTNIPGPKFDEPLLEPKE